MTAVLIIYAVRRRRRLVVPAHSPGTTRQKMTKQELKEEFKEHEGNPEVKAKLRQLRASARPASA